MTPTQFYFPYFFNLDKFNKTLSSFGLSSYVTNNEKTKMPQDLIITEKKALSFFKSKTTLLTIPFGATLMVQNDKLNYWSTGYDTLDITQIQLAKLADTPIILTRKIDLLKFSLGHNKFDTDLDLNSFVTYIRKENLKYDQEYYEKFVLVFINKDDINILPFDWFNKTGGDYGYVWPATAQFDKERNKLYGHGMRMGDFIIDIDKASL
ncbi:MAG: hypothetical protein ACKVOM_03425 [Ferruginibacter sp.]